MLGHSGDERLPSSRSIPDRLRLLDPRALSRRARVRDRHRQALRAELCRRECCSSRSAARSGGSTYYEGGEKYGKASLSHGMGMPSATWPGSPTACPQAARWAGDKQVIPKWFVDGVARGSRRTRPRGVKELRSGQRRRGLRRTARELPHLGSRTPLFPSRGVKDPPRTRGSSAAPAARSCRLRAEPGPRGDAADGTAAASGSYEEYLARTCEAVLR